MNGIIDFIQYMFVPVGQPWYTGQFWGNQTQWTVVTVPTLIIALWRIEVRRRKQHEELKQHITNELGKKK